MLLSSHDCVYTHTVEEWQVIEIGNQVLGTGTTWRPGEMTKDSPPTRARKRWKNAIKQQILLNRMNRENQLLKSESNNMELE